MTTPLYPSGLPGVEKFSWSPTPQILSPEPGPSPRSRRRRTRTPGAIAEIQWLYTGVEFDTFDRWYRTDLLDGHKWFVLRMPSGGGFRNHVVRFIEHSSAAVAGHKLFRVTATIEVLARKFDPEILTLYFTSLVYPLFSQDEVQSAFDAHHLQLFSAIPIHEELETVFSVIDLTLVTKLKYANIDESLASVFSAQALTLDTVRKEFAHDEALQTSFAAVGLTLEPLRIEIAPDTDPIQSAFSVIGLTLETP